MTSNNDQLFARAHAAIAASRSLIRQAEFNQQIAMAVCEDRFHQAAETARMLRQAEQYIFRQRRGRALHARSKLFPDATDGPALRRPDGAKN